MCVCVCVCRGGRVEAMAVELSLLSHHKRSGRHPRDLMGEILFPINQTGNETERGRDGEQERKRRRDRGRREREEVTLGERKKAD